MNHYYCMGQSDFGPHPYKLNVKEMAVQNKNFRTAVWTGCQMQMTMMCIPPCQDIGWEMHPETDQFISAAHGNAIVLVGSCKNQLELRYELCQGDAVFIPAGTWHNIINHGRCPLKLSSVYAGPNHPWGTVHRTKADAQEHDNGSCSDW